MMRWIMCPVEQIPTIKEAVPILSASIAVIKEQIREKCSMCVQAVATKRRTAVIIVSIFYAATMGWRLRKRMMQ